MTREPSTLVLAQAQGTTRYTLDGRVMNGGDIVQLCCSGGWLTGRFECDMHANGTPMFFFSIELEGGRVDQQAIPIPDGALLRWL